MGVLSVLPRAGATSSVADMDADQRPGVRYARDVGPGDNGVRVALRRRLAQGGLGDLLGTLESWADGVVRLRDRHGELHVVDENTVVAAKRVPPAPVPRRRAPSGWPEVGSDRP